MRTTTTFAALVLLLGCSEPVSTDNEVEIELEGSSHAWRTNDGECRLRNMSSTITCVIEGDVHDAEDDFSLSLNVGFDEVLEERTYTDDPTEAFPDITVDLWFPGDGEPGSWRSDDTIRQPGIFRIHHLGRQDMEADFDVHLRGPDGEVGQLTGSLDMVVVE